MAEYAHIIGDSPDAARGIPGESERLAKDPANLMILCFDCHKRIDDKGKLNEFSAVELHAMKREHEARIQLIYSATGVKDTLPILMSFPIGKHVPVIGVSEIRHAILQNSEFTRFPLEKHIHLDESAFDLGDAEDDFWPRASSAIDRVYERRIHPELIEKNGPSHLTIAALAPIPLLVKLGALVGDKTEVSVFDLPGEKWLWDKNPACPSPNFQFNVPSTLPKEVAIVVSISNLASKPNDMPSVEFRTEAPNRGIVRKDSHVQDFRRKFNEFLLAVWRAGARVIHIHPATPLSVSVEMGRLLLPKLFEEVHVWDWRDPNWVSALRLK